MRNLNRESRVRLSVPTMLVAASFLTASATNAQTVLELVPSVAIGTVYDNNLFAKVEGSAGQMLQARPGLETTIKSPRVDFSSELSFDAQKSNFASLNTLDARRHAMADLQYKTSPGTTLGLATRYDRTETPGELDIDTAILGDRRQAHRWQVTPSFAHRVQPRTFIRASYDYTDESIIENASGQLHTIRAGFTHERTERTTFIATYMGRQFVDDFGKDSSQTTLFGVDRELAPGTRLTLQGGPRMSSYKGMSPELMAGFVRSTERVGIVMDYWHGETIVLGIRGPVGVDSFATRAVFPLTQNIEIGTHAGASDITTVDKLRVTVYRGTLVASWSPDTWYTVAGSYGIDYQLGDIRPTLLSEDRVLRNVFHLSMTIAPRIRRIIKSSDDPAARAKGVTR